MSLIPPSQQAFTIRSNLRQARGTGVPPVGSEDLTWGMAGTAMPRLACECKCYSVTGPYLGGRLHPVDVSAKREGSN